MDLPAPRINAMHPAWAPTDGGVRVMLIGSGFRDTKLAVCRFSEVDEDGSGRRERGESDGANEKFGDGRGDDEGSDVAGRRVRSNGATAVYVPVRYTSVTSISCIAPPHEAGTVLVSASLDNVTFSAAHPFTYRHVSAEELQAAEDDAARTMRVVVIIVAVLLCALLLFLVLVKARERRERGYLSQALAIRRANQKRAGDRSRREYERVAGGEGEQTRKRRTGEAVTMMELHPAPTTGPEAV